jgi:hypothetical protein
MDGFRNPVPLESFQLYESVHHGYFEARTLKFLGTL